MSKIAILDTAIDAKRVKGEIVEHISFCNTDEVPSAGALSHGTMCALVLDECNTDYELVNLQILSENTSQAMGDVHILAKALKVCKNLGVDIVSISCVTSLLSDSEYLYDITRELSETAIIVSALDNGRFVTIPTSFPHVIGVSSDTLRRLPIGGLAHCDENPLGINVFANCEFPFLFEQGCGPSNSFAVPVVVAYVNDMLNKGCDQKTVLKSLRDLSKYDYSEYVKQFARLSKRANETPVVFVSAELQVLCAVLMDTFRREYEVQSSALSFVKSEYDVRTIFVENARHFLDCLSFMQMHFKTDLVFVVGTEEMVQSLERYADIDVALLANGSDLVVMRYENNQIRTQKHAVATMLYKMLSE